MTNEKVYRDMMNYIKENGLNDKAIRMNGNWFSAKDWSGALGYKITPQRLTSMANQGLVDRIKDRAYFGDNNYRYWPIKL